MPRIIQWIGGRNNRFLAVYLGCLALGWGTGAAVFVILDAANVIAPDSLAAVGLPAACTILAAVAGWLITSERSP